MAAVSVALIEWACGTGHPFGKFSTDSHWLEIKPGESPFLYQGRLIAEGVERRAHFDLFFRKQFSAFVFKEFPVPKKDLQSGVEALHRWAGEGGARMQIADPLRGQSFQVRAGIPPTIILFLEDTIDVVQRSPELILRESVRLTERYRQLVSNRNSLMSRYAFALERFRERYDYDAVVRQESLDLTRMQSQEFQALLGDHPAYKEVARRLTKSEAAGEFETQYLMIAYLAAQEGSAAQALNRLQILIGELIGEFAGDVKPQAFAKDVRLHGPPSYLTDMVQRRRALRLASEYEMMLAFKEGKLTHEWVRIFIRNRLLNSERRLALIRLDFDPAFDEMKIIDESADAGYQKRFYDWAEGALLPDYIQDALAGRPVSGASTPAPDHQGLLLFPSLGGRGTHLRAASA